MRTVSQGTVLGALGQIESLVLKESKREERHSQEVIQDLRRMSGIE